MCACMHYLTHMHACYSILLFSNHTPPPPRPQLSRCVAEKQALTHSLGVEKVAHIKTLEDSKELRAQLGRSRAQSEVSQCCREV